ncbi:MAG TPA: co-chaperone GroES family protein [Polyangiales bacterium]|nr:co-chaperone GroES family protein [Polyangiales bacterium]
MPARALRPVDGAESRASELEGSGRRRYARVIVRKDKVDEIVNGVVQPERYQRAHHDGDTTPWRATVIASGSPDLRAGERVLLERYAGSDVVHDGERLTILPAREVLAVLEDES